MEINNNSQSEIPDLTKEGCFTESRMLGSKYIEAIKGIKKETSYTLYTLPVIESDGKSFRDKQMIKIITAYPYDKIFYSFEKKGNYKEYKAPLEIDKSIDIYTFTQVKHSNSCAPNFWFVNSDTISAHFFKKPNNYTIDIKSTYNPQYHAGGPEGLIDGIFGSENWRKGDWQGYQGQDFEAVVDLQKEQEINFISSNFLQDSRSWIVMPTRVEFFVSTDNITFSLVATIKNTIDAKETETKVKAFTYQCPVALKTKYVKVKAYNYGKLPEWHQGFGGDAFIFIDEITIK